MKSRSEAEMRERILRVAEQNPQILAVLQDGSRSDPNVPQDIFQDYDIIYVVKSLEPFLQNPGWTTVFGETMILQMPEDMELYPPSPELEGAFSYLMQFTDGNRIDLVLVPLENLDRFTKDSLCKILWDKSGVLDADAFPPANDADYIVQKPTERAFIDCCNEFWYTNSALAKGLWREQTILAQDLLNQVIRGALLQMMDWYIACRHGFAVNPGKSGKFYRRYLEPELYDRLLTTYSDADLHRMWQAVYNTADIFRDTARFVAAELGYTYPENWDKNITGYLRHVQQLPKDAGRIYGSEAT